MQSLLSDLHRATYQAFLRVVAACATLDRMFNRAYLSIVLCCAQVVGPNSIQELGHDVLLGDKHRYGTML